MRMQLLTALAAGLMLPLVAAAQPAGPNRQDRDGWRGGREKMTQHDQGPQARWGDRGPQAPKMARPGAGEQGPQHRWADRAPQGPQGRWAARGQFGRGQMSARWGAQGRGQGACPACGQPRQGRSFAQGQFGRGQMHARWGAQGQFGRGGWAARGQGPQGRHWGAQGRFARGPMAARMQGRFGQGQWGQRGLASPRPWEKQMNRGPGAKGQAPAAVEQGPRGRWGQGPMAGKDQGVRGPRPEMARKPEMAKKPELAKKPEAPKAQADLTPVIRELQGLRKDLAALRADVEALKKATARPAERPMGDGPGRRGGRDRQGPPQ